MRKSKSTEYIIRWLFHVLLLFSIAFFLVGWLKMPSERMESRQCEDFNAGWYQILEDGSKVPVEVPGNCEVARGEQVVITNTLPDSVSEDSVLGLITAKQDMRVAIDGEERISYSTKDTRWFGKSSVSIYLLVPLSESDSGKSVTVEFSSDSAYAGVINSIYYGTEFGIWNKVISENIVLLFCAVIMIVFSLLSIVVNIVLYLLSKKQFYLDYLGWAVMIIAAWLLCQSPLRQLYFENVSLAGTMAHLMLLLIIFPITIYVNSVQKFRYNRFYMAISIVTFANWLFCVVAMFSNFMGDSDVQYINLTLCVVLIAGMVVTIIRDYQTGHLKEYQLIVLGLLGLAVMSVLQIAEYFSRDSVINGGFICIGVIFVIGMAMIASIFEVGHIQREKYALRREVNQKSLKIENLTYQAMMTLAQTIDAKDAYTKGHSTRVAEYSRMIAERAGKDEDYQVAIYFMGLLHDIGKIGVKDEIINKPGRLTDEEFAMIKSHPAIGYDILKNMTEIENIEYGARWHHERYDGTGYPDGIKGEEIPEYARIIAIADAYDAMASNRSYRSAMPQDVIREEIIKGKGRQFDPELADIMLLLIYEDVNYDMRQKD